MKKAGKITIAVAVMIVCLLVTGITAGFSLSDDKTSLEDKLKQPENKEDKIQDLENERAILSGEEATNGEGEPGTSEEESLTY